MAIAGAPRLMTAARAWLSPDFSGTFAVRTRAFGVIAAPRISRAAFLQETKMGHAVAAARTDIPLVQGEVHPKAGFWALVLGSIGVVYGDIGTSPLYAMRESVMAAVGAGNAVS